MRCNHQARAQHVHAPSARNLITAISDLHVAIGRIGNEWEGQSLIRQFALDNFNVDLTGLIEDDAQDPADGPGYDEEDEDD